MVDKHNIPTGKMHGNCMLLPDHMLCKITQKDNMRRANTCDPALKLLNEEITSDMHTQTKHKEGAYRCTLGSQAQDTHFTKTIHGLSNRASSNTLTNLITFNNKITKPKNIANCFSKKNHKHCQTHKTNRYIDRSSQKIQGYNITLITTQVQTAKLLAA